MTLAELQTIYEEAASRAAVHFQACRATDWCRTCEQLDQIEFAAEDVLWAASVTGSI